MCGVLLLLAPLTGAVHPGAHTQLELAEEQIRRYPEQGKGFVKHARVLMESHRFEEALENLVVAAELAGNDTGTKLGIATTLAQLAPHLPEPDRIRHQALEITDKVLAIDSKSAKALKLKARLLTALRLPGQALSLYHQAVTNDPRPAVSDYIEWANSAVAAGDPALALEIISRGINHKGPALALIEQAAMLELNAGKPEQALAWYGHLRSPVSDLPAILVKRAELAEAAGLGGDTSAALYCRAVAALRSLPPARRRVPAQLKLLSKIEGKCPVH